MKEGLDEGIIIDSNFTLAEVLKEKQEFPAPQEVLRRQRILEVIYYSFDGKLHKGQVVVDVDLVADVKGAFDLIRKTKFPVKSVIPFVDRRFMSEDERVASLNNSSGFNYRTIAKTNKLSNHALGRAIDINPALNPFIEGEHRLPEGAEYDAKVPGTIVADGKLVAYFKARGWVWGGDWAEIKDYMHFEKS
jgi:hypothetical protein